MNTWSWTLELFIKCCSQKQHERVRSEIQSSLQIVDKKPEGPIIVNERIDLLPQTQYLFWQSLDLISQARHMINKLTPLVFMSFFHPKKNLFSKISLSFASSSFSPRIPTFCCRRLTLDPPDFDYFYSERSFSWHCLLWDYCEISDGDFLSTYLAPGSVLNILHICIHNSIKMPKLL